MGYSQLAQGASYIAGGLRFGTKPSVVTSYNTVWPVVGQVGPVTYDPNSADYVQFASTNANDTASGSGTRQIFFLGYRYIDDNDVSKGFQQAGEFAWLNGTSPVTSTYKYVGPVRAFANRGGDNVGSLFVGKGTWNSGVPDDIWTQISAGEGQTEQVHGYLPNSVEGHVHYLSSIIGKDGGGQDILGTFRLRSRQIEWVNSQWEFAPWRIRYVAATISDVTYNSDINGFILQGPCEIDVQVEGSGTGARASAQVAFELHKDFN